MSNSYLRPDSSNSFRQDPSSRRPRALNSAFSHYADSATIPYHQRTYRAGSSSSYYSESTNADFLDLFESSREDMRSSRAGDRALEEGSESTQQLKNRRLDGTIGRLDDHRRSSRGSRQTVNFGHQEVMEKPAPNMGLNDTIDPGGLEGGNRRPGSKPPRKGFNPWKMIKLSFLGNCKLSTLANCLFPTMPAAIAVRYALPEQHLLIFILNYLAMVPAANILCYCGEQLSLRMSHSAALVFQLALSSVNELILMILLLFRNEFQVIQAAIIGSVLANLLLVTGTCFVVGGLKFKDQKFDHLVAETGGSLLLMAAVGMLIPTAFATSIPLIADNLKANESSVLGVSRSTAILLLISYALFLFFQLSTHQTMFDRLLQKADQNGDDFWENARRPKLSIPEGIVMCVITLAFTTLHAIFLVEQIHWIVVHQNISDAFMGLILVPLVEKVAEHISAVDQAWDDSMDMALSNVLGSTIQTSLFVAPIVVIVGWIAGRPFDLNFDIYMVVVYFLAVLVVGNFIKDKQSNYLEGAFSIIFYAIIAVTTYYYPNPPGFDSKH